MLHPYAITYDRLTLSRQLQVDDMWSGSKPTGNVLGDAFWRVSLEHSEIIGMCKQDFYIWSFAFSYCFSFLEFDCFYLKDSWRGLKTREPGFFENMDVFYEWLLKIQKKQE